MLGAAIVVGSGQRFIMISFSALSVWHREQLCKYGRPDEGTTVRFQVTQSRFTIGGMGFICNYDMKYRLFTHMS